MDGVLDKTIKADQQRTALLGNKKPESPDNVFQHTATLGKKQIYKS